MKAPYCSNTIALFLKKPPKVFLLSSSPIPVSIPMILEKKVGLNYIESFLIKSTKTTSALERLHKHFFKSVKVIEPHFGKLAVGLKKSKYRADRIIWDTDKQDPFPSKESQYRLKRKLMHNLVGRSYKKELILKYLKRVLKMP
ncbi:hypothetical protein DSO57_1003681 [Entomophthora muscae]|uniref:Uncharacterized protein n=1 Tax=Entomophthora muscae TaxID=34485 RepID=A0ACC2U6Q6_9FUNG|nr:hypothetical protein DSO57_1003681 [Entomophthora muscae]